MTKGAGSSRRETPEEVAKFGTVSTRKVLPEVLAGEASESDWRLDRSSSYSSRGRCDEREAEAAWVEGGRVNRILTAHPERTAAGAGVIGRWKTAGVDRI